MNDRPKHPPVTLILSVGGSPQPLATALREIRPDRVIFVVSEGAESSETQVTAREIVYDRNKPEGAPGRMGRGLIYVKGCPDSYNILRVPADDPGRVLALVDTKISEAQKSGEQVIVDYTGGTKSMTAGLVMAATAHEGVKLQFMLGKRRNLEQVDSGTEQPTEMPQALIGLAHVFAAARSFVARYNYATAAALIAQALGTSTPRDVKRPKAWNIRLENWHGWLEVLRLWDGFHHREAFHRWETAHESGKPWADAFEAAGLSQRLRDLAEAAGKPSPLLVEDLWLNAERRARMGQYDDAVARLYRLMEAAVQGRLHARFNIDTSHVLRQDLPPDLVSKANPRRDLKTGEEYYELGLTAARDLLRHKDPQDDLVKAWPKKQPQPDWQGARNHSILAHGFMPLGENDWKAARSWFLERRGALWGSLLQRPTADQLPDEIPRGL